jgi:alkyl hydroperoxide reductase subunit AhpF
MKKTSLLFCALLQVFLPALASAGGPPAGGKLLAFFHGGGGKKAVLKAKERDYALEALADLEGKVELVLFSEEEGCKSCDEAERFVKEISALTPHVSGRVLRLPEEAERASELGVERTPGLALLGASDPGIRYYGIPLGYEFEVFVGAVRQVAAGKAELRPETVAGLEKVRKPVIITVFVAET